MYDFYLASAARTRACARPVHRRTRPARVLGSLLPVLSSLASRALPWQLARGLHKVYRRPNDV